MTHPLFRADTLLAEAWRDTVSLCVAVGAFRSSWTISDGVIAGDLVESNGVKSADEFEEGAADQSGGQVRGQVVVEEELAAHEVEREVVGGPAEEEETCGVVQAGAGA